MPVQMHGMTHHGIVVQNDAHILALFDQDFITFRNCFVVECPDIPIRKHNNAEPLLSSGVASNSYCMSSGILPLHHTFQPDQ